MKPDLRKLTPSARVLYDALLSLRGKRVCVQVERLSAARRWATVRGFERFDEDLSVLVNHGLVIVDADEHVDELQVLTPAQSEGAAVMAAAERDWHAARAAT